MAEHTTLRCTRPTARAIRRLSQALFDKYEDQFRTQGWNQPSMKVAVDYLLFCAIERGEFPGEFPIDFDNNLYVTIVGGKKNEPK